MRLVGKGTKKSSVIIKNLKKEPEGISFRIRTMLLKLTLAIYRICLRILKLKPLYESMNIYLSEGCNQFLGCLFTVALSTDDLVLLFKDEERSLEVFSSRLNNEKRSFCKQEDYIMVIHTVMIQ